MSKHILFLTGSPGVGKTTLLLKILDILRNRGYTIGGMVSREVRQNGTRIGFEILDLSADKHGWLAHVNQKYGPKVGKYHVNLDDLEKIGVEAILKAVEERDVIVIDEIGPMELFSAKFKIAVEEAFKKGKLVLGVIHWKVRDKLINAAKTKKDVEIFEVTKQNRDQLHEIVVDKALEFLAETQA
ncbi:MAG: NTPase [Candidatus Bathyarchaeia archaeon]